LKIFDTQFKRDFIENEAIRNMEEEEEGEENLTGEEEVEA
jgi:hypothetical protein